MAQDADISPITLSLWGAFRLCAADGRDLTPRLGKCQALLALLATARDGTRTRSWLQARLWSDRGREQAGGSLRQALALIRKALDNHANILISDRQRVTLDLRHVTILPPVRGEEFLAGIDINDEEFEDWLRQERAHHEAGPAPQAPRLDRRVIAQQAVALSGSHASGALGTIETFLVDSVARSLRENFAVRTYAHQPPHAARDALSVTISAVMADSRQLFLTARCISAGSAEMLWSGQQMLRLQGALPFDDLELHGWINEIVAAVAEYLRRDPLHSPEAMGATHLGLAALRELFSMQSIRVAEADAMLARAHEMDPRAIFLAWRAQLRGIQTIERHGPDEAQLRDEGLAFAAAALESEPTNSSVLATVANARKTLDQDMFACEELSRLSVAANPGNPLGWWSRALAHLYAGRLDEAMRASERGHLLSRGSPYRFWWDMQVAVSACSSRHVDKAIISAERCAVFAPNFRPPMRYLIGLYAERGATERAAHWARQLRRLEPDFAVERLMDGDYPASLLSRHELVRSDNLRPVADRLAGE